MAWVAPTSFDPNIGSRTYVVFQLLFGRRPAPGWTPQSAEGVRDALLAINRPTAPFVVRPGAAVEAELIAEWRIADAGWHEIFAKAHLEQAFKVLMRLDRAAKEVRAVDQEWRRSYGGTACPR